MGDVQLVGGWLMATLPLIATPGGRESAVDATDRCQHVSFSHFMCLVRNYLCLFGLEHLIDGIPSSTLSRG